MIPHSKFSSKIILVILWGTILSFLISLVALQIFTGLLILLWLFEKNESKKQALDVFSGLFILFFFIRFLATLFSEFPKTSYEIFYKELLFFLGSFSFGFYLKTLDIKSFMRTLNVFIYSGIIVSVIGIISFNLGFNNRAQSITSGYSTFSMFILIIFLFSLALSGELKFQSKWYIPAIRLGILLTALITSMGRTNIVIAIIGVIAALILQFIKFKQFILIFVIALVIAWFSFSNNFTEVSNRTENIATLSDRDILYEGFFQIWDKNIFLGFGPRTFKHVFPLFEKVSDKKIGGWHNEYIQTYVESGILGLATLIILMSFLIYFNIKAWVFIKAIDKNKMVAMGLTFSFIGLSLAIITDGFVTSPIISIVFVFLLGISAKINCDYNIFKHGHNN